MLNVGTGELVLVFVLALIVLGPDKLPNAARQVGRYLADFRRISSGFQQEFRNAVDSAMQDPSERAGARTFADLGDLDADFRSLDLPEVPDGPAFGAPGYLDVPAVTLDKPDRARPTSPAAGEPDARMDVEGPPGSFS